MTFSPITRKAEQIEKCLLKRKAHRRKGEDRIYPSAYEGFINEDKRKDVIFYMYRALNENSVFSPSIYRTPEEIKAQINDIKDRIEEVNDRLNIRELMDGLLSGDTVGADECLEMSALLESAIEALDELRELNSTLDELKAELLEVIRL